MTPVPRFTTPDFSRRPTWSQKGWWCRLGLHRWWTGCDATCHPVAFCSECGLTEDPLA